MATFDERIAKSIEDGGLPGVVLLAKDKDGKPRSSLFPEAEKHLNELAAARLTMGQER